MLSGGYLVVLGFSENSELHFGNFRTILNTSKEKPEYPVEGGDRNEHLPCGSEREYAGLLSIFL